jgi:hypothetical protein
LTDGKKTNNRYCSDASVFVVRLTEVHEGQHHEDEGLQRDDQDVEDGPDGAGDDVAREQQRTTEGQGSRATE